MSELRSDSVQLPPITVTKVGKEKTTQQEKDKLAAKETEKLKLIAKEKEEILRDTKRLRAEYLLVCAELEATQRENSSLQAIIETFKGRGEKSPPREECLLPPLPFSPNQKRENKDAYEQLRVAHTQVLHERDELAAELTATKRQHQVTDKDSLIATLRKQLEERKAELQALTKTAALASIRSPNNRDTSPQRERKPRTDRRPLRTEEDRYEVMDFTKGLIDHLSAVFKGVTVLKKDLADLAPEEILARAPGVVNLAKQAERLLEEIDSLVPPSLCVNASISRFEFTVDTLGDPGQPEYFAHIPREVPSLESSIEIDIYSDYNVCPLCNKGIKSSNFEHHVEAEHRDADMPPCKPAKMTARWALDQCRSFPAKTKAIRLYTLESPLCYGGNAAMRNVRGNDRNPFDKSQSQEEAFAHTYWMFLYHLHQSLRMLPDVACTAYRAISFKVSAALYFPGAIVTWNQPSSTSSDPRVVKSFLGGGTGGAKGTIFIIHLEHGKDISSFSQYPEEKEVLVMTNTQFRVLPTVGSGVKQLLSYALRANLQEVLVVELQEIKLSYYQDIYRAGSRTLRPDERTCLRDVLRGMRDSDAKRPVGISFVRDMVANKFVVRMANAPLREVSYPMMFLHLLKSECGAGTWNLILHRLPVSVVLNAKCGDVSLLQGALERTRLNPIVPGKNVDECVDQYLELPSGVHVVAVLCNKIGFQTFLAVVKDDRQLQLDFFNSLACTGRSQHLADMKRDFALTDDDIAVALKYCAMSGYPHAVKMLLSLYSGDKPPADINGVTAIHIATAHAHEEVLKELISGPFLPWVHAQTIHGENALHIAVHVNAVECTKTLIRLRRALLRTTTFEGLNPLHIAATNGHLELVQLLTYEEKDLLQNSLHYQGRNPLWIAAYFGHLDVVKFLHSRKESFLDDCPPSRATPFHIAIQNCMIDIARFLSSLRPQFLHDKDSDGWTSLKRVKDVASLDFLLREDMSVVDDTNPFRWNIAHIVARENNPGRGDVDAVLTLLKRILAVRPQLAEAKDFQGFTPFHPVGAALECGVSYAVRKGEGMVRIMSYLHSQHPHLIDVTGGPDGKSNVLHLACENGDLVVAQWALQTRPRLVSGTHTSLVECACRSGSLPVLEWLIKDVSPGLLSSCNHASVLLAACRGKNVDMVKYLAQYDNGRYFKALFSDTGIMKRALCNAARLGALPLVKYLIEISPTALQAPSPVPNYRSGGPLCVNGCLMKKWDLASTTICLMCRKCKVYLRPPEFFYCYACNDHYCVECAQTMTTTVYPSPFLSACYSGCYSLCSLLLHDGVSQMERVEGLLLAAGRGFGAAVRELITGAGVTVPPTLLHRACSSGDLVLVKHLIKNYSSVVSLELEDESGMTALHRAVRHSQLLVVRYLLDFDSRLIDLRTRDGRNCLDLALEADTYRPMINLFVLKGLQEHTYSSDQEEGSGRGEHTEGERETKNVQD